LHHFLNEITHITVCVITARLANATCGCCSLDLLVWADR